MTKDTQNFFASLTVFIFIFLTDYLVHGIFLEPLYTSTANLWRNAAQMEIIFPFGIVFQMTIAVTLTTFYTKCYKEHGIESGFKFGLYLGILMALVVGSFYIFMPIPQMMATAWIITAFFQMLCIGLILGRMSA